MHIKIAQQQTYRSALRVRSLSTVTIGPAEVAIRMSLHRLIERGETGFIPGAADICHLGLGEMLVAIAD